MNAKDMKRQEENDFRTIMATAQGLRFVRRLAGLSGVFGPSYAGADTHATAFREGRRSIGLHLLWQTGSITPEHLTSLMQSGNSAVPETGSEHTSPSAVEQAPTPFDPADSAAE